MALFLEPLLLEGKRQDVTFGEPRHWVDMAVAQALDEALIVAGLDGEILTRQPPAGEDGEGLQIGLKSSAISKRLRP